MGLDITHCETRWSYHGFDNFRTRIAETIGIPLDLMQGYTDHNPRPWDMVDDPLEILLMHSDCDGKLTPQECAQIYPRLEVVMQEWGVDEDSQIAKLIRAMKFGVEHDVELVFH